MTDEVQQVSWTFPEVAVRVNFISESVLRFYAHELSVWNRKKIKSGRHERFHTDEVEDLENMAKLVTYGFTVRGALENLKKAEKLIQILEA